jgi:hypothetical protein
MTMDATIASMLAIDGVTNGALYALLAMTIVLVFAVTRILFKESSSSLVHWDWLTYPPASFRLLRGCWRFWYWLR